MSEEVTLSRESIRAVAEEIAQLRRSQWSAVLPLHLAAEYVFKPISEKGDSSAFRAWCKKYRVKNCSRGRWAKEALDRGLRREASIGLNEEPSHRRRRK